MNGTAARFLRLGVSLAGLVTLGWVLTGQAARPAEHGIPLPTDWSHHHLVFSRPGSAEQAARVSEDPRYWQQMYRREQRLALPAHLADIEGAGGRFSRVVRAKNSKQLHRDWFQDIGPNASAGAGNYPAKYSFSSKTANCGTATTPDYVVYSTGLAGSATQASIVAYDNLYSGCGGTVPSVYWAYNTSGTSSGAVLTSPVPSLDGSQIAFAQTDGAGAGTVVLLKWKASTTDTVRSPTSLIASGSYPACTAPCMATFALETRSHAFTNDTASSVFVDYSGDTAWVGDNFGFLHKFHPFFNGTPAEVSNAQWPAQVSPGLQPLGNAVFDIGSGNVFVVGIKDGTLYRVNSTTAAVTTSGQLDHAISLGGPIVNSTNGVVYVFAADDGSLACGTPLGTADCAGVYQLPTNFAAGSTGTEAVVGTATVGGLPQPQPLYDGFFDNNYIRSTNATGNLYVCGNTGLNATLYQVPIQNGVMSAGVALSALATGASRLACSPVTDVSDPGATAGSAATEHVFVGVQGNSTTCGGSGCVQSLIDTPWQASTTFAVGQEILVEGPDPAVRDIDVVIAATGTSGTTQPIWGSTPGTIRVDNGVTWLSQGNPNIPLTSWAASHAYPPGGRILDGNGNVEVATTAGTSGSGAPTWATTPGLTTAEGPDTLVWTNAGAAPMIGLPAGGGSSGIIIDNTVGSGVLAGTSQIYFTTQGNECGTLGGDGCAVQASQSGLN